MAKILLKSRKSKGHRSLQIPPSFLALVEPAGLRSVPPPMRRASLRGALTGQAFGRQRFPLRLDGQRGGLEPRGRSCVQPRAAQHAQRGSERATIQHPRAQARVCADQGPQKWRHAAHRGVYPKLSPAAGFPLRAKVGPDSAQRSAVIQHQDSPRSLVPVLFYSPLP